MKYIQSIGINLFFVGLIVFTASTFIGNFYFEEGHAISETYPDELQSMVSSQLKGLYAGTLKAGSALPKALEKLNESYRTQEAWDKVIYTNANDFALQTLKENARGVFKTNPWWMFFLTFGLGIIGSLMYIVPGVYTLGYKGIKNNGIYHDSITAKKFWAYLAFVYLVGFYIVLYFYPQYLANQILILDPISKALSGNAASQWFLYGFLYCVVMLVMGIRMYIKYRHNAYQMVRTTSVLFFQIAFAFLIPELLVRFNKPYFDFKNAWPLDYDFFFDWNINNLMASGNIGLFMLVWGIALTLIVIPVLVYFYGKRWYCSWVCGCGGLAETLGDPFRQHSNKSVKAWKLERWLIHGVLVFAIIMTGVTLYSFFSGVDQVLGLKTYDVQKTYGFLIGSVFSGVIGTGFYPVWGNRVWCRFGCPLAAYMGIVQRFKSRFRITTNGGQCISCGNCSTYCEQGIDVRAYAQKGENIVRASCVGCGVCSAVCPRGVLKLENGPEQGRINSDPIMIGSEGATLNI